MSGQSADDRLTRLWEASDGVGQPVDASAAYAYSEEAFRHFLAVETKRAERARRSLLLLLVSVNDPPGAELRPLASGLFEALGHCIRNVDFLGWYHHERVAGAVLTQGPQGPGTDAAEEIVRRVIDVLGKRFPHFATRFRVRILRVHQGQA